MSYIKFTRNLRGIFFAFLYIISFNAVAAPRVFECRGAKIMVNMPEYIEFSRAEDGQCVFWKNKNEPDYSGYYFSGSLRIDGVGTKNPFDFRSSTNPNDGTWAKLLSKKTLLAIDDKGRYIRIDQGNYKIKFLSPISETETDEKIENIARIEGEVFDGGVWVHLSFAIPYKYLTRDEAVGIIKSIKVQSKFNPP